MHILFLTDNFPPEGNAPATRTFEHAREWVKEGHKVTVITCAPNFPEGKVFEGYKNQWLSKNTLEGIRVWRVKTYITANEGFLKRTLDFLSFMVASFFTGLFVKKPDVIVGTSPQFFTVCSAWALSFFRRKPFVFELRDIWPASITAVGAAKDSLLIRLLEKLELFLYRQADAIVSVTHSFKKELVDRGVNGEKISVVLNGVDLSKYSPSDKKDELLEREFDLKGKFVVAYIGTHGMAHGLEHIVDAAQLLDDCGDICFLFVGGGAARQALEERIFSLKLKNVRLIPRQPKEAMPRVWSLCDISIVSLIDTPLFQTVIPSKIFESMGMGLPILMTAPNGEATEIVQSTGSGCVVPPENPKEFAAAVKRINASKKLQLHYKASSQKSALDYSRERFARSMLQAIEAACNRTR